MNHSIDINKQRYNVLLFPLLLKKKKVFIVSTCTRTVHGASPEVTDGFQILRIHQCLVSSFDIHKSFMKCTLSFVLSTCEELRQSVNNFPEDSSYNQSFKPRHLIPILVLSITVIISSMHRIFWTLLLHIGRWTINKQISNRTL